jgi:hypothetical protein
MGLCIGLSGSLLLGATPERSSPATLEMPAWEQTTRADSARAEAPDDADSIYQNRNLEAIRADAAPIIDGQLDEAVWATAAVARRFTTARPDPGKKPYLPTEIRVLYDDNALYIGAHLIDPNPDSIEVTLTERDDEGNADWFRMVLCPYQDGQNGMAFTLTAAGVQIDEKWTGNSRDRNFDAVWNSAVRIGEDGWYAEMEIPYGALRFPTASTQDWGINFVRTIRRIREESWWRPFDVAEQGTLQQVGTLRGLENIRSPFRLSLTPYVSGIAEVRNDPADGSVSSAWDFNGGMDLKYGINDAFTLDMTLVPDFNQVRFDNEVLNLGPFEVFFNENRLFFTEGTELFNKQDLFYSRRVGGRPVAFGEASSSLEEGERIVSNPAESRLLNATKISGRTDGGLGIGVFNGITARSEAQIETVDGSIRTVETGPLSNYSVVVLDQNLKRPNSYLNFTNTNVWRAGGYTDANVTGLAFQLSDKDNQYQIFSSGKLSQRYHDGFNNPDLGHAAGLVLKKISGRFQGEVGYWEESDTYDPNDLGFLFNNNTRDLFLQLEYNRYQPKGRTNQLYHTLNIAYSRLYRPDAFFNFGAYGEATQIWRSFFANGTWLNVEPVVTYDWFEPREAGRFLRYPVNAHLGAWISSDYRKPWAIDARANYRWFDDRFEGLDASTRRRQNIEYSVSPRWRANDKLLMIASFGRTYFNGDLGWVNALENEGAPNTIIMGRRDVVTTETGLRFNYIFTNRMFLTFRMRHYWSKANYISYHALNDEGWLDDTEYDGADPEDGSSQHNVNFNAFTIDAVFTWRFAPGSDLFIVWKDGIFASDNRPANSYFENLERTFQSEQANNLSVRIVWYLDYVLYRRWRERRLERRAGQDGFGRFPAEQPGAQNAYRRGHGGQTTRARSAFGTGPWMGVQENLHHMGSNVRGSR